MAKSSYKKKQPEKTENIIWEPNPGKQTIALQQTAYEILYGGARGGGKTDAGIAWLTRWIHIPKLRALVIRQQAEDLRDWVDRADEIYSAMGGVRKGQPPEFHFPSGAIIRTGHLKDENAFNKYKGHEYQKIIIEELTQIPTERQYQQLIGSLRSTVDGLNPQIFCTTNPDGPGKKWVKARWKIDNPLQWDQEFKADTGRGRIFVSAKIDDNPALVEKDPGYIAYLESLPDDLRAAWREGSWDNYDVEGAYYTKEIGLARKEKRIGRVPHDPKLPVHTVWDLGIADAMSIGFYQVVGMELRMIDYHEESGEGFPYYIKMLQQKPYVYGKHFAPHDISVRELGTGKSRLEVAASLGIDFEIVPSMPVQDGIDAARNLFKKAWFNYDTTESFLDAITQYRRVWDDKMGTFKDRPFHDWTSHAADMWRYTALVEDQMDSGNYKPYVQPQWEPETSYFNN